MIREMYPMASECPRYTLLLGAALVYNAPLLLIAAATRRRLPRNMARSLIAMGFAAAAVYTIWKMEWFDVWRHGRPSAQLRAQGLPA